MEGTLTVRLESLVDRPECLKKNTGIGIQVNDEVQKFSTQDLDQKASVTFNGTQNLCDPVNVTVGMNFWDGNVWVTDTVATELDPFTCIGENLSDSESLLIQAECPNLRLNMSSAKQRKPSALLSGNKTRQEGKGTKTQTVIICSVIICTTLIICAAVIALVVQIRKRPVTESKEESSSKDDLEVERENVTVGAELGSGCFGTVYKGTLKDSKQV